MTSTSCQYSSDREAALVAYLYNEADAVERSSFETHLVTCVLCRAELDELGALRSTLGAWTPPAGESLIGGASLLRFPSRRRWWQEVPAWAKAAAAVLLLAAGVGLASLEVRYDNGGVLIRSGWMAVPSTARGAEVDTQSAPAGAAPWRAELAALERKLEDGAQRVAAAPSPVQAGARGDVEMLKEMRAMIAASERRQQRELALRVGEALRDVQSQRQADLVRIDRTLGLIQNDTGAEVLRQRRLLNDLAVRVSQRP